MQLPFCSLLAFRRACVAMYIRLRVRIFVFVAGKQPRTPSTSGHINYNVVAACREAHAVNDILRLRKRTCVAAFHATVNRNSLVVVLAPKHHSKRLVAKQMGHLTTRRLSHDRTRCFSRNRHDSAPAERGIARPVNFGIHRVNLGTRPPLHMAQAAEGSVPPRSPHRAYQATPAPPPHLVLEHDGR